MGNFSLARRSACAARSSIRKEGSASSRCDPRPRVNLSATAAGSASHRPDASGPYRLKVANFSLYAVRKCGFLTPPSVKPRHRQK